MPCPSGADCSPSNSLWRKRVLETSERPLANSMARFWPTPAGRCLGAALRSKGSMQRHGDAFHHTRASYAPCARQAPQGRQGDCACPVQRQAQMWSSPAVFCGAIILIYLIYDGVVGAGEIEKTGVLPFHTLSAAHAHILSSGCIHDPSL